MEPLRCKVVLLGDGKVGKTCLLHSYANGLEYLAKRRDYNKTLLENYELLLPINDGEEGGGSSRLVRLSSWDTAGQEEFDELRRMCYTSSTSPVELSGAWSVPPPLPVCEVSVLILCFAWDDPQSLTSVQMRWYREIRRLEHEMTFSSSTTHRRPFNVVLCGTKFDLRVEADQRGTKDGMVTREQAYNVQQSINADALVICSSKMGLGVQDVFHTALLLWLQNQSPYTGRLISTSPNDSMSCKGGNTTEKRSALIVARRSCHLL
ncbi:putative rho-like GTP binding protein [Trypanosoma grayi]|uniref:putative rho-like GTP binding protein n=1 Tax=Trypanosoma grayi TaxID=71804 RepID=UPI0004F4321D|nr:putative rho-like GTP binding protein [Trypanosoma grayi]KEG14304.1 putative rho-like GTP binding protein [Trypanosoma grayi]